MSKNLLSSFLEYRNNPFIKLRTKGPLAFGYRPPSFLCGQTQTRLFHVWLHSLEYIRRVHEHLNPVHLTVRRLLYLTKTKSKFNRAQHVVDYEPGVMSGLSRSLLRGVGEAREEQWEVLRGYRSGNPVPGAVLTGCQVSAYITSDVPGSLGGHDGNGIASQVVAFLLSFFHGLAIEALGKEGRHFQLENSHSLENHIFGGGGSKEDNPWM